jgi:ketosteroid isomerase-like protein
MSQENANAVARRWLWAFENDTDAFRDTLHPEIEWFPFEDDHSPSYGVDGGMRIRNQWIDTWGEHRIDLEELIERGDSVVASVHVTARGKSSGVEVDARLHLHFTVREGKVVYVFEHADRAAALEAVRLREQAT